MSTSTKTNSESGDKHFSEVCERNKEPILNALRPILTNAQTVLEIGSGTGQHAVHFGQHLPQITWQTSDIPTNHPSIRAWIAESNLPNVKPPITLNMDDAPWSLRDAGLTMDQVDAIYTSNTLHIVNWKQVTNFFNGIAPLLTPNGLLCVYGPFKYDGKFSGEGDASFDTILRGRNVGSAIRDFEELDKLAQSHGLQIESDVQMPANNHLLVWRKTN